MQHMVTVGKIRQGDVVDLLGRQYLITLAQSVSQVRTKLQLVPIYYVGNAGLYYEVLLDSDLPAAIQRGDSRF